MTPVSGLLADYFGTRLTLKVSSYILGIMVAFNCYALITGAFFLPIIFITAAVLPLFHTPVYAFLLPLFKIDERYQCLAFSHALGSIIFSGSAPLISTILWQKTHIAVFPLLYFLLFVFIMILSVTYTNKNLASLSSLS